MYNYTYIWHGYNKSQYQHINIDIYTEDQLVNMSRFAIHCCIEVAELCGSTDNVTINLTLITKNSHKYVVIYKRIHMQI